MWNPRRRHPEGAAGWCLVRDRGMAATEGSKTSDATQPAVSRPRFQIPRPPHGSVRVKAPCSGATRDDVLGRCVTHPEKRYLLFFASASGQRLDQFRAVEASAVD